MSKSVGSHFLRTVAPAPTTAAAVPATAAATVEKQALEEQRCTKMQPNNSTNGAQKHATNTVWIYEQLLKRC